MTGRRLTWWERITGRCIYGVDGPPQSETRDIVLRRHGIHQLPDMDGVEIVSIQFRGGTHRKSGEFDIQNTVWLKRVGCGFIHEATEIPLSFVYVKQTNHFLVEDDSFIYREYHLRIHVKRK